MNEGHQAVRLQRIGTQWSKEHRGNPGAARRAALPQSLLFPPVEGDPGVCLHQVTYFASRDYEPLGETLVYEPSDEDIEKDLSLRLYWEGSLLRVLYLGIPEGWAQPEKKLFELRPGQWGRLVDSWRITTWEYTAYMHRIVNVHNGPAVDGRAFVGKPNRLADKRNWLH